MTNFHNLKIAINEQQPLDEVVRELLRTSHVESVWGRSSQHNFIYVFIDGTFKVDINHQPAFDRIPFTTLAELKEME